MSDEAPGRFENNRFCPIRDCYEICLYLRQQWNKHHQTYNSVADDATYAYKRKGITADRITRYARSFDETTGLVKPSRENRLTTENILWLCQRWGVDVRVHVTTSAGIFNSQTLAARGHDFDPNNIFKKKK